jgi:hypothetical protein
MKKLAKVCAVVFACLAAVVILGITVPCQAESSERTVLSNEYKKGNYKYYFEGKDYYGNGYYTQLYLCRSKLDGTGKKELCTMKLDDMCDVYVWISGYYKNTFYFNVGEPSDGATFCTANIKTKKCKMTGYPGVCEKISDTQYLLDDSGSYGDWVISSTYFFDAKTGKYTQLAKYCDFYYVTGNNIIYAKSSYDAAYQTHSVTLYKYNMKTQKKTKLKKIKKFYNMIVVKSNFIAYRETEDGGTPNICQTGSATTTLPDGTYTLKEDIYDYMSDGYLNIYGQLQNSSTGKNTSYKHYKFKLSKSCKFYTIAAGDKSADDKESFIDSFNRIFTSEQKNWDELRFGMEIVIKNGKITKITISD